MLRALLAVLLIAWLPAPGFTQDLQSLLQEHQEDVAKPSRRTVDPVLDALSASGLPGVPRFLERWQDKAVYVREDDGLFFYVEETGDTLTLLDLTSGDPVATEVDPDAVVDLAEAWLPVETQDAGLTYTTPWLLRSAVSLSSDPESSAARLHRAALSAARAHEAGSTLQLGSMQTTVATAADEQLLRGWLAGRDLPDGLEMDLELRWRIWVRLAVLGVTDRAELDAALDEEPTAVSRVEHTRAVVSLPTVEAKEFAFERFTGAVSVANYELRAAGLGMWREGQEELLAPYVERYAAELPTAARAHSGWVQADVAEDFFPACMVSDEAMALLAPLRTSDDLPAPVRRRVTDAVDELERRRAVIARFGRA